ncbi:MAG: response regulator [Proteobacteria bacterium]|nr:response regulator [Pseudomonadota bacterium]
MTFDHIIIGRNRIIFRLYIIFILLIISSAAQAAPPAQLKPGIGKYDLALHTDILEDPQGDLTLEQVSSPAYANQWVQNQQATPNFSFSDSVYWLRINLSSDMQIQKKWWLEVAFALQDYIDCYVLHEGDVLSVVHTGDRLPFNSRIVDYRNFLFELDISPKETRQIYLRLSSHDGLHEPCPIILWDHQSFALANGVRNLGMGLYFGIMVAMAIYNLFIFLSVRDHAYAYYVVYITGFLVWLATYYGYSFQYLWPNSPNWGNQVIIVSSSFWSIFMIQFVRFFLDTKRLVPRYDILSKVAISGLIFNIFFCFTGPYVIGLKILVCLGIPLSIAAIATGISCFRSGYRPARYFLLAWTTLLLSILIFVLKITGVLPATFLFEKSIQIGSAIEVILLSLGLADRINVLKTEKAIAQRDAIVAIESSLKLKNDFITSISHELRTPMNAIIGGLEVAQKHPSGPLKSTLDIIQGGASDMMNLVNDILTHTEIQSDRLTIQSNNIAIQPILKSLCGIYEYFCETRGLQLNWQVDATLPKWICIDEEKLVIILSKLLDNAIKFTEQGQVTLNITCDRSTVPWQCICVVKDTGIGIAREKQVHIFDSFTQSEGGFQRRYGGLGIGLSICKKLTEALGGELRHESVLGQGSTFTVILPIETGVEPLIEKNTHRASGDLPILVVEDNIANQKVMMKLLEKIGYKSLIANHGQEALDVLEKEAVSLILMDLQMPVMDGFTCTAKIRERDDQLKNIPIIAVTANLMDADKTRCTECGMNDFLKKPIKLDLLRKSLSCYVESGIVEGESDFFVMVDGKLIKERREMG